MSKVPFSYDGELKHYDPQLRLLLEAANMLLAMDHYATTGQWYQELMLEDDIFERIFKYKKMSGAKNEESPLERCFVPGYRHYLMWRRPLGEWITKVPMQAYPLRCYNCSRLLIQPLPREEEELEFRTLVREGVCECGSTFTHIQDLPPHEYAEPDDNKEGEDDDYIPY